MVPRTHLALCALALALATSSSASAQPADATAPPTAELARDAVLRTLQDESLTVDRSAISISELRVDQVPDLEQVSRLMTARWTAQIGGATLTGEVSGESVRYRFNPLRPSTWSNAYSPWQVVANVGTLDGPRARFVPSWSTLGWRLQLPRMRRVTVGAPAIPVRPALPAPRAGRPRR